MRFDFTDLRLFLAVAEAGSLTGGAEAAHLSLPAASERIRGLELDLGQALLVRGRRGVRLTAAGLALAQHARLVLRQVEGLRSALAEHAQGERGLVRLLCNSAAREHLPAALAPWLRANPGIDLELRELPSLAIPAAIAGGRAEIGILADHAPAQGLELHPFAGDRLVLAVPRGHRLARRRRAALAELLAEDFVGLGPDSALQAHLAEQAARLGGQLRLRVRLEGFAALCRLVAGGVGLAILPALAAARCGGGRDFAVLRLAEPWAERRLGLCVRSLAALHPAARRLAEALIAPR